jgi:ethanolamine utilization protein EutM
MAAMPPLADAKRPISNFLFHYFLFSNLHRLTFQTTPILNHQTHTTMAQSALGLLETRGLTALVAGVDAMLKSANVTLAGPMKQVGNALVTAVVTGDVAAVKAATEAGAAAARAYGEVVSVQVIARPHDDVAVVLPKAAAKAK